MWIKLPDLKSSYEHFDSLTVYTRIKVDFRYWLTLGIDFRNNLPASYSQTCHVQNKANLLEFRKP